MAGPIGRFLYTRMNVSPRVLLKAAFGDKRKLTPQGAPPLHRRLPVTLDATGSLGAGEGADRLDRLVRAPLAAARAHRRDARVAALGDEGPRPSDPMPSRGGKGSSGKRRRWSSRRPATSFRRKRRRRRRSGSASSSHDRQRVALLHSHLEHVIK